MKGLQSKPFAAGPGASCFRADDAASGGKLAFGSSRGLRTHRSPPATFDTGSGPKGLGRGGEAPDKSSEVAAFLRGLGLSQHTEQLVANGFDDMDTLMHMEDADMRDLGLPAIHVVKLRRKLQELLRKAPELDEGNPVVSFLRDIGLVQYAEVLLQNGFDELDVLLAAEDGDMKDLGIPRGHAVKLKRRLREYQHPQESRCGFPKQHVISPAPGHNFATSANMATLQAGSAPDDEQKTAVQRSWEQVQAMGTGVAELLYRHTFELEPEVIDLFPPDVRYKYRDWTADEGVDESNVYASPALRKLFAKYMNAIGCTVAGLNDFSKLVPMLRALGARHVGYGVAERHWPILGRALMLTLRDVLGGALSSEVESAWMMVYGFMSNIMIEGLRSAIASRERTTCPDAGGTQPCGEKPPSVSGGGSERPPLDDDARSQGSLTTGVPAASLASADTWGRQTSMQSEGTPGEARWREAADAPKPQPAGI